MIEKIGLLPLKQQLNSGKLLTEKDSGNGFGEILKESLNKVNSDLIKAENLTRDFTLGRDVELHQVVLAAEQASLALQLTIQLRNKVVEAYQEVMRMQL